MVLLARKPYFYSNKKTRRRLTTMMTPSYFTLALLAFIFSVGVNASAGTDACKAGACLTFRALSKSCGYDLDTDAVGDFDQTETRCICGDRSYKSASTEYEPSIFLFFFRSPPKRFANRIYKSCFDCMADQEHLDNYGKATWDNKCFKAFDTKPPAKKTGDSAKGIVRQSGERYAIYGILVTVGVGLLG